MAAVPGTARIEASDEQPGPAASAGVEVCCSFLLRPAEDHPESEPLEEGVGVGEVREAVESFQPGSSWISVRDICHAFCFLCAPFREAALVLIDCMFADI